MSQQFSLLTDYFEERANNFGPAPAYYSKHSATWHSICWSEFADQARTVANGLETTGLALNDVVAILLPTGLDWEVTQVAVLLHGATVVGLDEHDLPDRLAQIIETSGARGIFVQSVQGFCHLPKEIWSQFDFVVCIEDDAAPADYSGRWVSNRDLQAHANKAFVARANPDTLATIIFTSGSTGRPKGIPYSHRQVCAAIDDILDAFPEIAAGDRLVCWLPLSNLFQRMINYCAAGRGAETYFVSDPRTILQTLPEVKPHLFISVPRFFEKLYDGIEANIAKSSRFGQFIANWALDLGQSVAAKRRRGETVSVTERLLLRCADRLVLSKMRAVMGGEIKFLVSGSAPISNWLLERFHGMGMLILEAYGLSENVTPIAVNRVNDFHFGRVGRPMQSNEVIIAEDGEVLVKGAGVFTGYLGAPESEAGLNDEGYLQTGDLGEFDELGFLRLVGRKSEIFKTSTGRKVAPVPIEAKLKRIKDVDFAVLIGAARKMTSVIIAPSMEVERQLQDDDKFHAFAKQVVQAIRPALVSEQNYAVPLGALICRKTFAIDTEELTSNLKLRRKVIEEKHHAGLAALYERLENGQAAAIEQFDETTYLGILPTATLPGEKS